MSHPWFWFLCTLLLGKYDPDFNNAVCYRLTILGMKPGSKGLSGQLEGLIGSSSHSPDQVLDRSPKPLPLYKPDGTPLLSTR